MRHRFALLVIPAAALSLAAAAPEPLAVTDPKQITSAEMPGAGPIPIDDLFYSRSTVGGAWSPDGKEVVFSSNLTGRTNLWKVSAGGGFPLQLSQSDDRQGNAIWSADGKWIVYQSDRAGGEVYELFAIPSGGGAPLNITNTPDVSETDPDWSPDGRQLAISYKPKESPTTDVAVFDWNARAVRNLTKETSAAHSWGGHVWSPDGRFLYSNRRNAGRTDSSVFRIEVATGKREELTPHEGLGRFSVHDVSPDGTTLLLTAERPNGFPNIALLDGATKKQTWVTDLSWEATAHHFAPDGKSFAYAVNEDGRTDVYVADRATLQATKLKLPAGVNGLNDSASAFSSDGGRLLLGHQSSTEPPDLWVHDLKTGRSQQLTLSAIASLGAAKLPAAQLVHYKSFDGKRISALLWMPYNLKRDGSSPGVVLPHGGPAGQSVDSFSRTAAALASRGYVCIAPNVRGSTGYGIAFQQANHQDLGGGDLEDEVYAVRLLTATGYVDAKKIGITGGSYGGFMTLMAIGKKPELWAAGVEQFGIIDWLTMLEHEDAALQEYEKSLLGDPVKDRAAYENASPIKYLRNATAPLLVLQGENDIRVPKEEADQVVRLLKDAGKTVDAHYYAKEGHGFARRENQIDAITRTVAWFDRYLKGQK